MIIQIQGQTFTNQASINIIGLRKLEDDYIQGHRFRKQDDDNIHCQMFRNKMMIISKGTFLGRKKIFKSKTKVKEAR